MSFDHVIDALQMTPVSFILWLHVNLIEENVSGQQGIRFLTVFRLSRIGRCIESCAVLQENCLATSIPNLSNFK